MSDLIYRDALKRKIRGLKLMSGIGLEPVASLKDLESFIDSVPAVAAVPVVRRGSCKYYQPKWPNNLSDMKECVMGLGLMPPDGYCCKGKNMLEK